MKRKIDLTHFDLVDESEVPMRTTRGTDWLSFLNRIPKGKAAELTEEQVSASTLREVLLRLKKRKQISECFTFSTVSRNGKKIIYVLNSKESEAPAGESPSDNVLPKQEHTKLNIPNVDAIVEKIMSFQSEFSMQELQQAFFGKTIRRENRSAYQTFYKRGKIALEKIQKTHPERKLSKKKSGTKVVYRFQQ